MGGGGHRITIIDVVYYENRWHWMSEKVIKNEDMHKSLSHRHIRQTKMKEKKTLICWRSDLWTYESIQIFHDVTKRISENRWNSEMEKQMEEVLPQLWLIRFFTGIPWVQFSHTIPVPAKTVPVVGMVHSVAMVVTDAFQKNWIMISVK